MKAPPFTVENAAEMGRRSVAARAQARERELQELEEARELARSSPNPNSDEARRLRVQKQIDLLLSDMELAKSVEKRLQLGSAIERLWKLVQPTAGVNRPGRQSRRSQVDSSPIETPQISHDPVPSNTTIPTRDMSQEM